ncbi:LLM class flavin-dependent oxidoreductase [Microbacterium terricola]|uniref:Alkanesulfonate monooxygenase n=1 Tax=Microbacterium terricola TaxID=344163 RepID=A0ABM8DWJ0_9MICO|nr:LLM class flavin-dependent oxidoreductase [Microbacterium terricola]UYK39312.1 LLM class flavin-dependent oxidoreductase [Microbacterium terricola]BDV29965.1 putative alkanesulfonate monooxygenase [Microbacterium terricola]
MTPDPTELAPLILDWFLPLTGDSRTNLALGSATNNDQALLAATRPPGLPYISQIARAAEHLGFAAVLIPTGGGNEESWTMATALTQHTRDLDYLVAVRPGLVSPTLQAQVTATFQNVSGGRLRINVVVGGEDAEQHRFGDRLAKEDRYRRADEYLSILRRLWTGEHVTHHGEFYEIDDAWIAPLDHVPEIYLGGSSPAALDVAAAHADVYLTWGEPPAQAGAKIAQVRDRAAALGRTLRYGVRLHVIARPTSDEAWRVADELVAGLDPEVIARQRAAFASSGSEGQRRQAALAGAGTTRADLEVHPGLWAGAGLVRGGAGTALVGSYDEVADLIAEYRAEGFQEFVLSGYPHLEEAYWFAEGVRPELARRGLL